MNRLIELRKLFFILLILLSHPFSYAHEVSSVSDLSNSVVCKEPIVFGWDPWPPYSIENASGSPSGIDMEIVSATIENVGCRVEYLNVPWKRIVKLISDGKIHLTGTASKTAEREDFAYFTNAYRDETIALFVQKGHTSKYKISSLKDISGMDFYLGVLGGAYYGDRFEQLLTNPDFKSRIYFKHGDADLPKLLVNARVKGILEDPYAVSYRVKQSSSTYPIEMHSMPAIKTGTIHIMLSKKVNHSKFLLEVLNESLNQLKANGKIESILSQYAY